MEIIQTRDSDQMVRFLGVIKDQVSLFQDLIQVSWGRKKNLYEFDNNLDRECTWMSL